MVVSLSNLNRGDGLVTAYCDDKQAAAEDQTIDGVQWEIPEDVDPAYAVLTNRPALVADLEAEGYQVETSDYSCMG